MSKTNNISIEKVAELLKQNDEILILPHKNPDGDTLGCAFALREALEILGKKALVSPSGTIPSRYCYMTEKFSKDSEKDFKQPYIVAVDTASVQLVDEQHKSLCENADISIDHHQSNEGFAKNTLVDSSSSSCCEIVFDVIKTLGVEINHYIASCIYTGLATDTGCFKYRNTTIKSHLVAAEVMEYGIDIAELNRILFEQKSRARLELEKLAVASIEYYFSDKVAIIFLTREMFELSGAKPHDVEGITPIPKMIEGVEVGVTIRELGEETLKVSLRTNKIDAAAICREFGGGGHKGAAGFEIKDKDISSLKIKLLAKINDSLEKL